MPWPRFETTIFPSLNGELTILPLGLQVIKQNPDRETMKQKLHEIQEKLSTLNEIEAKLDDKLEDRKKQFYVLVNSIHQLQELLNRDNDLDLIDSGDFNLSHQPDKPDREISSTPDKMDVMEVS